MFSMSSFRKIGFGVLLAMVVALCPNIAGAGDTLLIGSGGVAGMYYPAAGAVASLVARKNQDTGLRIAVVPSLRASMDNVEGVASGGLNLGMVQSDVLHYAVNGTGPFAKAGANPHLRSLFTLYSEVFTVVARNDSGIESFKDLAGKRISMGSPGASYRATMEMLMREYGWDTSVLTPVENLSPEQGADALGAGTIDAFVYMIGHPYAVVGDAVKNTSSHIVPISGPEVDSLLAKHPYYPAAVIPAGTYPGLSVDSPTFGPKAVVTVSADMSEETAYLIVKTVFENFDEFKRMYPAFAALNKQDMLVGTSAPLHEGAMRYYREIGLVK